MPETWNTISRTVEPVPEAQINIRGPQPAVDRFKRLCGGKRRTYFKPLERMMEVSEARFDQLIE
ncbi:hypothetical protein [Puniceibacterium sediminis]|uniref:Uncharacterized protein n=1 Tax=Puniceibacterium sediminis TaxID=1608407 RepID=A0A238Z5L5_9RHOB|nr:hypothetical protein [Puniceibacterium sediminis]SNR78123.1 hypothetical protein SAMN06265370_12410 [Puniceibacterium sediminis]